MEMITSFLIPLVSGLLSGIVVAVLNYFLTRKKTEVEIRKLEAETEKIRIEIGKNVESISATVSYKLAEAVERIIYDSNNRDIGYDFEGRREYVYRTINGKATPISPKGRGTINIEEGGVLNIQRTNTEGRYEIWLQCYLYNGAEKTSIPRSDLMSGQRNLRITCEAKISRGEHTLRFLLKNEKENKWLAYEQRRVISDAWTPLKVYLQVSPTEECRLRIDDEDVSQAPSSIQIRNFVLAEKAF